MNEFDPPMAVDFTTACDVVAGTLSRQELGMTLLLIFGATALVLAAIGIRGDRVIGFQASALIFSTPGCWEVSAQVADRDDSKLTFETRVVKIGHGPGQRREPSAATSSR